MEKSHNEEDLESTRGKNSTHCEQLTTEIFNWKKEYGYLQTISEISRVREVSLRKKIGKHRTLHNEFWTCELIFLGEDSGWIICEMIPDKWARSMFRLWGRNPTITVWSDGLRFLSWKAPFLLLGILWRKRVFWQNFQLHPLQFRLLFPQSRPSQDFPSPQPTQGSVVLKGTPTPPSICPRIPDCRTFSCAILICIP